MSIMPPPPSGRDPDGAADGVCVLRPGPAIVVHRDFDGFFERVVRRLLAEHGHCRYDVVHVDATPYLPDAVQYEVRGREIHLTFYSALRRGFGALDWDQLREIL